MASRSFLKSQNKYKMKIDAVLIYAGNNEHSSTMYSHCLETQSKTPTQKCFKTQTYRLLTKCFPTSFHRHRCCTGKTRDCLSNVALQVHKKQPNHLLRQICYVKRLFKILNNISRRLFPSHNSIPFFLAFHQ